MTIPVQPSARSGVDRRRRLLAALHERAIEDAYRDDGAIRADLEAEAAELDADALLTPEMLDHLRELIADRARLDRDDEIDRLETRPQSQTDAPGLRRELFFSTDVAVIVPGFLASVLRDREATGSGLIWLAPELFFKDRLGALKLGDYDGSEAESDPKTRIEATGALPILYDFLRLALEVRRYATEVFAVDWRKDVEIASARLEARLRLLGNDARPVHLVAHSQGALVARRALQRLGPSEARRIVKNLVLLGPANYGSFSAAFALLGAGEMVRLARRLAVEPTEGFHRVLTSFSGLYQLLPYDADRVPWLRENDLGDPAFWGSGIDANRLRRFHGWARGIDTTFFNDRTTVILGDNCGEATPGGLARVEDAWISSTPHALPGDGTVTHSCAVLPGARTYLATGVEHSLTAARRSVIDAVLDVFAGRAPKLSEMSSDPLDHLGSGPFTGSIVVHPTPARELKVPPPRLRATRSLNGKFLTDYDDVRALPERPATAELFRRDQLLDELAVEPSGVEEPGDAPFQHQPSSIEELVVLQSVPSSFGRSISAGLGVDSSSSCFELILDASNLLPFDFLRTGDRLGRAVVKIERSDGSAGTAFLVAPDILLTNNHVLPDTEVAATSIALANFETAPAADASGAPAAVPLDPDTLFVTNAELDFTFCAVRGLEYLGAVPLTRNSLNVLKSEYINIIQHPRGRPKEVVVQDNRVVRADNVVVQYSCDTEPGSSGSPVFNNQWKLVALHHASVQTDDPEGKRSRDGDSRKRYLNEGVRLSAIATWLETTEANHPEQREAVERLRAVFEGLDPQIGFFGALGRHSRGRSAAEVIVEIYRGGCGDLDVAYWDLAGFALDDPKKAAEFARAIAELNMDVWCLENISAEATRALRQRLESKFKLDFAVAREPSLGRPAVLQRRRDGLAIIGRDHPAIRATTPRGCSFEFDLESLRDVALRNSSERSPRRADVGRLIVGGAADWSAVDPATIASTAADPAFEPLVVGSTIDGAIAVVPAPRAAIERVFASPNLALWGGRDDRAIFTRDRDFPEGLLLQGPTRPVAVRLSLPCASLDADPGAFPCNHHCQHPSTQTRFPDHGIDPFDDAVLERRLRALLVPLLAQILGGLQTPEPSGESPRT